MKSELKLNGERYLVYRPAMLEDDSEVAYLVCDDEATAQVVVGIMQDFAEGLFNQMYGGQIVVRSYSDYGVDNARRSDLLVAVQWPFDISLRAELSYAARFDRMCVAYRALPRVVTSHEICSEK